MKRTLTAIAVFTLLIVVGSRLRLASSSYDTRHVDALKILAAAKSRTEDLQAREAPVPASVSLKELIDRGLLAETDVSELAGVEAAVSLSADESRPRDILVRARLPGGHEIVALADGSVQQIRR